MTPKSPTAEGLRRWPDTQGFFPDRAIEGAHPDRELPCECSPDCASRCAGGCGCQACGAAFAEFLDVAGYLDHAPLTEAEEHGAMRDFQGVPESAEAPRHRRE